MQGQYAEKWKEDETCGESHPVPSFRMTTRALPAATRWGVRRGLCGLNLFINLTYGILQKSRLGNVLQMGSRQFTALHRCNHDETTGGFGIRR